MRLYGWMSHGEEIRFFVDIAVCAGGMTMAILTDAGRFIGVVLVVPICIRQERLAARASLLEL
ncbi:hypothetical protein D3C80_1801290 [compost metagenome]